MPRLLVAATPALFSATLAHAQTTPAARATSPAISPSFDDPVVEFERMTWPEIKARQRQRLAQRHGELQLSGGLGAAQHHGYRVPELDDGLRRHDRLLVGPERHE